MKKTLYTLFGFIVLALIFISWGSTGHYKINSSASLSFPQEMNQFNSWTTTLANHAADADNRKSSDPSESPKHYIDIDNYPEFNNTGTIPQTLSGAIAAHGSSFVYDNGILPWATKTAYDSLKSCFQRLNWDKAVLFASDLGHYVADGHMPLHITRNYNGQYTGNDGIHSRYESTMINSYISQITYAGENINIILDVNQYIFNYVYLNNSYVSSVIAADNYAKNISSNTSSTEYKTALWNSSKDFTILLFKNASHALAELIYTAWVNAGSPSMTAVTGIENPVSNKTIKLNQNFPNPCADETTISYEVYESAQILIQVTDISGNIVETLLNEHKTPGVYSFNWATYNLPNSIFYLILNTGKEKQIIKVLHIE